MRLRLELDPAREARLQQVMRDLSRDPVLSALGTDVSETLVLRFLVNRALDTWPTVWRVEEAPGEDLPPDDETEEVEKPEQGQDVTRQEDIEEEPEEEDLDLPDVYPRPPLWEFYDDGPWDLPESQTGMHGYYSKHGWVRAEAQTEHRLLNFYWTPKREEQGLKPWPGQDDFGRRMVVQSAPTVFGTAHLVPDDWNEEHGDAEIYFSP